MQGNSSVIAAIAVGAVIVCAVVYGIYSSDSSFSALSEQNTSLKGQIASLNQQISNVYQQESSLSEQNSNLGSQITGLSQQNVGLNQQLSNLQQQVSTLEQRTLSVVTVSNTVVYVQTTSVTTTSTVTSITAVPISALVIVADSYNSSTDTFTFQAHNNQNYTIYAQVSATLFGNFVGGACQSTNVGSFISQVYTFNPRTTTQTTLNLALGSYTSCASSVANVVNSLTMSLVVPPSTSVSPTYNFNVVPSYTIP